nr:hypothetical protein [Actinoplanes ferrugineus]
MQQAARCLQPYAVDVPARSLADLAGEGPRELARRQARPPGESRHAEIRVRVVGDPPLRLAQSRPRRQLRRQLGAELRLVARPAQEHHQMPGDLQRDLPPEVLLDQRQRQVDAGRDARRGGDRPVADEMGCGSTSTS